MGKVVEKKRKKKGRPSLLDLQKRSIKEQQGHLHKQHKQNQLPKPHKFQNPNPNSTSTLNRRSTRRNPNPDLTPSDSDAGEDDDDQSSGKPREKKLKLVLKLPNSSLNSGSPNSGSESNAEDDNTASTNHRKRKVDAISNGSGRVKDGKENDHETAASPANNNAHQGGGINSDDGPSTPLPVKKLLLFILDRLQKKDTYGVFAEPVDPEELPDYHEVIRHPMDFSTVRKKLDGGSYASLEQFEKDVFLICSNAMQYNAPDTIYFRQARGIQELAKKDFENLRQDSDDNEPEPKTVRRGRPPTKNFKKPVGRPSLERATSEISGATLATGGDNSNQANHDLRKGIPLEKLGSADSIGRPFHGPRQGEIYISWSAERRDRTDEITGAASKGTPVKHGKKQVVLDESRRSTYIQSSASAGRQESSTFSVFGGERKLLIPVGLHTEYSYARSLSRFAAKLGPVAWRVASRRIERCLPPGVKFGPGWVGENEASYQRPIVQPSPVAASEPLPQHSSLPGNSSSAAAVGADMESSGHKSPEDPEVDDDGLSKKHAPSHDPTSDVRSSKPCSPSVARSIVIPASSPIVATTQGVCSGASEPIKGFAPHTVPHILNSSSVVTTRPGHGPAVQMHPNSLPHRMNGVKGTFGAQMEKATGVSRPTGFSLQHHQKQVASLRTESNSVSPPTAENSDDSESPKLPENPSAAKPSDSSLNSGPPPLSAQGSPPQQKPDDSVPPDLNVRFQSPGSPGSGTQPDLALQL